MGDLARAHRRGPSRGARDLRSRRLQGVQRPLRPPRRRRPARAPHRRAARRRGGAGERLSARWRRVLRPRRSRLPSAARTAPRRVDELLRRAGRGLHHHRLQRRGAHPERGGRPLGGAAALRSAHVRAQAQPSHDRCLADPGRAACHARRLPGRSRRAWRAPPSASGPSWGSPGCGCRSSSAPPTCTTSASWPSRTRSWPSPGRSTMMSGSFIERHTVIGERILARRSGAGVGRPNRALHPRAL